MLSSAHCLVLVALMATITLNYCITPVIADMFTSAANVHNLFNVEKDIGREIRKYISEEQTRLETLKSLAEHYESISIPDSDVNMLPADGYAVIKRIVDGLSGINEHVLSETPATTHLNEFLAKVQHFLPKKEDLTGAAASLLRLQRTYEVDPVELVPSGTVDEYLFVGQLAYQQKDYASAVEWMLLAYNQLNVSSDDASPTVVKILDYLAFSYYELENYDLALNTSRQLLSMDPSNLRVQQNVEYYQDKLSEQQDEAARAHAAGELNLKKKRNYAFDNLLSHGAEEMANFRQLCRGDDTYVPPAPRSCYLRTYGKAHLLLKPIKVEEIMDGIVDMKVFRDFAKRSECEHLKDVARGRLERAVAFSGEQFMPTDYRISTVSWLRPDHDAVISRLHTRIADATNLDLEYAEHLQISNYGMGGHYEPHYDYHGSQRQPENGDRLSTFMIYLNDVRKGGATAFPRLGVHIAPKQGDAAFWRNLYQDGIQEGNPATLHGGCPVLAGSKWVANKWIHEVGNEQCPLLKGNIVEYKKDE